MENSEGEKTMVRSQVPGGDEGTSGYRVTDVGLILRNSNVKMLLMAIVLSNQFSIAINIKQSSSPCMTN